MFVRCATYRSLRGHRRVTALIAMVLAVLVTSLASGALPGPLNDLFALGQGTGDMPAQAVVQRNAEPPLTATPLATCGPGSRPQPGVDGRVPAGSAANGLYCNATLIG